MDSRDKHLSRHMRQRLAIAAGLPVERQISWAQKCISRAALQRRTAFYLMANLWLGACLDAVCQTSSRGEI